MTFTGRCRIWDWLSAETIFLLPSGAILVQILRKKEEKQNKKGQNQIKIKKRKTTKKMVDIDMEKEKQNKKIINKK